MTIDEYLNQLQKLRRKEIKAYNKMLKQNDRATSLHSSFNFDMPRSRSNENRTETRLLDLADAQREWINANKAYYDFREQLQSDLYNCLYWEGLLIEQVYIVNCGREDNLYGADVILKTENRGAIISKLREAKAHNQQTARSKGTFVADLD